MRKPYEFIPFLSDYGFKITFGDEADTLFLRKSLQALISSKVPIQEVQFLNNEFQGETKDSRGGLYDLICKDKMGRTFIVEMQKGSFKHYMQRSKYYAFQRMSTLVQKGKFLYSAMDRIYCIGFLGHNIFPGSKEYYHFGTLKNQHCEEMDNQITHVIIEIRKFELKQSEVKTDLEKLLYIMKNLKNFKMPKDFPHFVTEEWIDSAIERLRLGGMTAEQRMFFNMMVAKEASLTAMYQDGLNEAVEKAKEEERKVAAKQVEAAKKAVAKAAETAKKQMEAEKKRIETEKRIAEAEKRQAEAEKRQAEAEKQRAEAEKRQAEAEKQRAEAEKRQAKAEKRRAIKAASEKNIQIAEKLLAKGMSCKEIAEITGLSTKTIKKLK